MSFGDLTAFKTIGGRWATSIDFMKSTTIATPLKPLVCLVMIVRDEESVLARCIASVVELISHWIVVDTGSVDDTTNLVQRVLGHLPGQLHSIDWPDDFAAARNVALTLSRDFMRSTSDSSSHLLFMDADDVLEKRSIEPLRRLIYTATTSVYGALRDKNYSHQRLISARLDACIQWHGRRHEWLELLPHSESVYSNDIVLRYGHDGYRRRHRSEAFRVDQHILAPTQEGAETWRSAFYYAATLEAVGNEEGAKAAYLVALDAAQTEGNIDHQWQSAWGVARMAESGGDEEVNRASRAYAFMHELYPGRAEAVLGLSRISLFRGQNDVAFELADAAFSMSEPTDALIFDWTAYSFGRCDQLMQAAAACGDRIRIHRALERCDNANFGLAEFGDQDRLRKNLDYIRSAAS
jgi:tetratricopeptide (TPR) repeat protein